MAKIIDIKAREVLDSRGNPTIEADVTLEGGFLVPLVHRVALLPVPVKLWNCVTAISPVTWAKAY